MPQIRRHCQVYVRNNTLMNEHMSRQDVLLTSRSILERHPGSAVLSCDHHRGGAGMIIRFAADRGAPAQAFQQQNRLQQSRYCQQVMLRPHACRRGIDHRLHVKSRLQILPDCQVEQRSRTHKHRPVRAAPTGFQHRLRRPDTHHPGQGPAGDRHRTFHRAGRNQHGPGLYILSLALPTEEHLSVAGNLPYAAFCQHVGGHMREAINKPAARPIVISKKCTCVTMPSVLRDVPIYLTTRGRLIIKNKRA